MKKLVSLIALLVSVSANAQTLETTNDYPTGYMTTSYYSAGNTIKSIDGVLYMIDYDTPVTLIKYPAMNERVEYEIPSTVRRISNNAFQGTKYLKTLKLHNTVTYGKFVQLSIGESAFNDSSIENFVVIEDDESSSPTEVKAETSAKKSAVRQYDTNGRLTSGSEPGVRIVQYDDRSTEKVLTK